MPPDSRRRIVLASRSPQRAELARAEGWDVVVVPPPESAEESAPPRSRVESLEAYVVRLAVAKALAVAATGVGGLLLACDTLSEVDGLPLGKPKDRNDARRMLEALSGRGHRVVSGVCLWGPPDGETAGQPLTGHEESTLWMPQLERAFIEGYLDTGLWRGKAGACGFQDGHVPLQLVAGSQSNVVGLPLELVRRMLALSETEAT
ncbi:MAG: septum formation protein Maf [Planctomycetes bacterium]|nr:septum formation protein Maf [Planctomycetota bacterium]